jgi:hypothetical protein
MRLDDDARFGWRGMKGNVLRGFIDPPTPFAPRKSWEDFLASLSTVPQDDLDVQREKADAERMLAQFDEQAKDVRKPIRQPTGR